jgi:hypothetical protein
MLMGNIGNSGEPSKWAKLFPWLARSKKREEGLVKTNLETESIYPEELMEIFQLVTIHSGELPDWDGWLAWDTTGAAHRERVITFSSRYWSKKNRRFATQILLFQF